MRRTLLAPWFFIRDMMTTLPMFWRGWIVVLSLVHFVGPCLFLDRPVARWMLGAALLGMVILSAMHLRMGMTRLMGLAHLPWVVPVWMAYRELASTGLSQGSFSRWLVLVAVVGTVCLVVDAIDVVRYVRGDREPTAPAP